MIKAIVFDLDDTLYYEKEYVLGALKEVAYYLASKYKKDSDKLFYRMVEILDTLGRGRIFNIVCEENNFTEDIKGLVDIYRNSKPKICLYKDSIETLVDLRNKGYKLGIITDGCSKVQWNKIECLNVKQYVDEIIVTDDFGTAFWKPHTKPYLEIMKRLDVRPEECVYVGDNPHKDFIGAKSLGIKTVRVVRDRGDHISVKLSDEYEAHCIYRIK